jgi:hypothetical protein
VKSLRGTLSAVVAKVVRGILGMQLDEHYDSLVYIANDQGCILSWVGADLLQMTQHVN